MFIASHHFLIFLAHQEHINASENHQEKAGGFGSQVGSSWGVCHLGRCRQRFGIEGKAHLLDGSAKIISSEFMSSVDVHGLIFRSQD